MELIDVVDKNNNLTGKVEDKDDNYVFSKRDYMPKVIQILKQEIKNNL